MEKNKGFTLVELLAVIVILGVLVGIGIPVYYNVTKHVKENEYYAKKKYIEEVAVRFAEENSILIDDNEELSTIFTPVKLITTGYLAAEKYIDYDDHKIPYIENPMNLNDNLVCHVITLKVEDYNYYAELSDSDTDCYMSNKESDEAKIGIKAYEINDNVIGNEMVLSINNSYKWVKNDIALVINPSIEFDSISYDIAGRKYIINKNNMFTGNASGMNQSEVENKSNVIIIKGINGAEVSSEYKITLRSKDTSNNDIIYSKTIRVRIDKRAPRVDNYQSEMWVNNKFETLVYINDGDGSGSKGLCYNNNNDRSNATCIDIENNESNYMSKTVKINNLENGNVYLWPVDNVGNEPSVPTVITIKNVDITAPNFEGITWTIDSDISCDNGIQCSDYTDNTCTCRKVINGVQVASNIKYDRKRTAKIKYSDNQSGVKTINYCITTEDNCSPDNNVYGNITGGKMEIDVAWGNKELPQKICYNSTDNVSNNSQVICSDKYYVDETNQIH